MNKNIISIIVAMAILIPALIASYITFTNIRDEIRLNLFGKISTADVTSHRMRPVTADKIVYELTYNFTIDGNEFSMSKNSEDQNWASLPKKQWENAKETGKVDILYLPSMPSINHPVFSDSSFFYETGVTLIVLLVIAIGCGFSINHQLKIINAKHQKNKDQQSL
ncbi:MAG: hypothetical protein JXK07_14565 [Spirochaetes bacterium]|nr:hypothetical protein [Spirochaetota bacterium]MBN2770217.1 hypothetical protein [Spirochaetota bacterium]